MTTQATARHEVCAGVVSGASSPTPLLPTRTHATLLPHARTGGSQVGFGVSKVRIMAVLTEGGASNVDTDTVVNKLVHLPYVGSADFIAFGKHPF